MKHTLTFIISLLFALNAAQAAENAVVLNIEPSPEFRRNSEGSFITLKSGSILFFYTQFYGGAGDSSAARIVSIHSEDEGRTWSKETRTVVENRANHNVMSVSLLRLKSGRIALFYLVKNGWTDCQPHVQFSDDEGATWTKPKQMSTAPGYFVLNNDRVIQLASGRLIAPLGFHRSRNPDPNSRPAWDSRSIAIYLLSDDEGETWREADTWLALPVVPTVTGLQEPGVVELADGKVLGWFRTDQGAEWMSTSADGGNTWILPAASELKAPTSPASIKRLPGSPDLLCLWNDHSGQFPLPTLKTRRTPFVAGISKDGGKTWPQRKLLEDDPTGSYCYTAIHFTKDAVLLASCAGEGKIGGLTRIRIRRISLDSFSPWAATK